MDTTKENGFGKDKKKLAQTTALREESSTPSEKTGTDIRPQQRPGLFQQGALHTSGNLITASQLAGVLCKGIQYYDLKNIYFINNAGMACLIDILRSLLKKGVEVRFVNVSDSVQKKIKAMGLDHILICK